MVYKSYDLLKTNSLISGESSSGISREDFIDKIATDVLNRLPPEFELDKIKKKFGIGISPTTVVLLQELERFNNLGNRMRRSLITLKRVCCNVNQDCWNEQ